MKRLVLSNKPPTNHCMVSLCLFSRDGLILLLLLLLYLPPAQVRIGKTLFYIFYLIHLNACAYYAMSAYEGLASNGWVYDDEGNAYIRCFYFATKTATSIGGFSLFTKTYQSCS